MAEEVKYASAGGESNKRKYDDSPSPAGRRATGFSSLPESAAPPSSYNSVPPPMSEIELAKQKAQEIAARLLSNVDPLKRARFENGGDGGGGGFDASDAVGQKPMGYGLSGAPLGASYGYPGPVKKVEIPNGRVGVIIGKGGETIKYLQLQSGAKIQVTRDMDADPNSTTRGVELTGTPDQIAKAEQLISDVLNEAEAGGSGIVSRRVTGQPSGAEQFVMMVPNNKVGLVIGKGGETIKNMQASTGARIQVIPLHLPPGDTSRERTVQIDGTSEQIEAAKQLVNEVISENRMRNSSMSGGYSQQGYQSRPSTNWAQPGPPIQQPGYGYVQPGAYPGQTPQYNQPPYSGYPPQPSTGGYAAGWDQSTAPQNPQAAQGGGYDYYNQQPPSQQQAQGGTGAPTDGSGYAYGQQAGYSQGQSYGQDGYGGYVQPQPNPNAGYEQQQQGYNSTYPGAPNPTSDAFSYGTPSDPNQAPAPGQAYNAGGQPCPNPGYPQAAATQPGYGVAPSSHGSYGTPPVAGYGNYGAPPSQKAPSGQAAYAQPEQSPSSAQGGGYAQQPPSSQPSSGYPTSQSGYGVSPYGAPPGTQPSYGQQQHPTYNSAYGGGYSQPPQAYSSDGAAGGNAHGTYDATPQSAQPTSGAAKASPPS